MSSPSRQISNRRLPPLPNSSRHSPSPRRVGSGGSHGRNHGSHINSQGHSQISHIDLTASLNDGPFRPALSTGKALAESRQEGHGKCNFAVAVVSLFLYCTLLWPSGFSV